MTSICALMEVDKKTFEQPDTAEKIIIRARVTDLIITDEVAPGVSTRRVVQSSRRLDPSSSLTLRWNWSNLMMTTRTRPARTASTGPKVRRSLWRETLRGARVPFLTSGEQLGATDESLDAVTKSIAEVSATIAKATKIRRDEHLNGPVILPVEDERLTEQLQSPTSMQLRIGTSREELPTRQLASPFSADSTVIISLIMESHCPSLGRACDEGA